MKDKFNKLREKTISTMVKDCMNLSKECGINPMSILEDLINEIDEEVRMYWINKE